MALHCSGRLLGEHMAGKCKIAVIVGSNRSDSLNRRLARVLTQFGADRLAFAYADIGDIPVYNADLESAWPAEAVRFNAAVAEADAVLLVTPEHNRSLPAILKSAIDWGSRNPGGNIWRDKPVAIIGAARGAIGTALAQQHVRQILGALGSLVMGGEAYIGGFQPDSVDAEGKVAVDATRIFLQTYMEQFSTFVTRVA
jgi:chromate reductase